MQTEIDIETAGTPRIHTCIHIYVYIYIYICNIHVHIYIYICIYTYSIQNTYIYTPRFAFWDKLSVLPVEAPVMPLGHNPLLGEGIFTDGILSTYIVVCSGLKIGIAIRIWGRRRTLWVSMLGASGAYRDLVLWLRVHTICSALGVRVRGLLGHVAFQSWTLRSRS